MTWSSFWQIISIVLYVLNLLLAVSSSILLIFKKQDPTKTLSWVLVMLLLPYIGFILYVFFGRNFRKEKMFSRKGAGDFRLRESIIHNALDDIKRGNLPKKELAPFQKLIIQNLKSSQSLLALDNNVDIYFSGKDALAAMCKAMEEATKHIHLQSFIIEDDKTGNHFKDILIKKAKEGVEVRFMYDGMGGRFLTKKFLRELREANVEVLNFSPFRWIFPPLIVNYRNHRKILVVDGRIGFLGGVNIADRYYDGGDFPEWRDTHVKLVGESAFSLQASFLLDRFFILNKNLRRIGKYYPDFNITKHRENSEKHYYTQIISSGPDSDWSAIMQCYFTAITQAKHHIYIITPYFTPSESIVNAIKITALSDVEVCLMIPERSDTWITNWGTMSYITELLMAGVKIYLFKKGFNHSKVLSIDGEFCIIGSANMDNRSFEHHFEVTSVIYNSECAQTIEKQFHKDISRCTLITISKWKKRKFRNKLYESIARLVSPLL